MYLKSLVSAEKGTLTEAGVFTFFSSILNIAGNFLLSIIIARTLGVKGRGTYFFLITTTTLFSTFIGLSLSAGVNYAIAGMKIEAKRLVIWLINISILQIIVVFIAISAIKYFHLDKYFFPPSFNTFLKFLFMSIIVLSCLYMNLSAILRGSQQHFIASVLDTSVLILNLLMVFMFYLVFVSFSINITPAMFIFVKCLVSLIVIMIIIRFVSSHKKKRLVKPSHSYNNWEMSKKILKFSLNGYWGNVIQFLNYRLDIFFVNFFYSVSGVGIYSLSVSLAQMLWMVPISAGIILFPKIASEDSQEKRIELTLELSRLCVCFCFLCGIFGAFLSPFLLPKFFGNNFASAIVPLLLLIPGFILYSITIVIAHFMSGIGKPQAFLPIAFSVFFITIILDCILIPSYGVIGAAVARSISCLSSTFFSIFWFKKLFKAKISDFFIPRKSDFMRFLNILKYRLHIGG
ncbi:polysaccharide biosynthesis C-terminal domain-containing protein [Chlamydiota bacterium]